MKSDQTATTWLTKYRKNKKKNKKNKDKNIACKREAKHVRLCPPSISSRCIFIPHCHISGPSAYL